MFELPMLNETCGCGATINAGPFQSSEYLKAAAKEWRAQHRHTGGDSRWRTEATAVLNLWDEAFSALPAEVRNATANLGRQKADIMREFIESATAVSDV